jgi:hypothetical protein
VRFPSHRTHTTLFVVALFLQEDVVEDHPTITGMERKEDEESGEEEG